MKNPNFPANPKEAIISGFQEAENEFIYKYALNQYGEIEDRSGSCAILVLVVDSTMYIANVGDSRCVLSMNNGKAVALSRDHKPNDELETMRITEAGGKVYQYNTLIKNPSTSVELSRIEFQPKSVVCWTISYLSWKIVCTQQIK